MGGLVSLQVDEGSLVATVEDALEADGDLVLAAAPDPGGRIAKARVTLDETPARHKPSLRKVVDVLTRGSPRGAEAGIGGKGGAIVAKGTGVVDFIVRSTR